MLTLPALTDRLEIIRATIIAGGAGTTEHWQGADVKIVAQMPEEHEPGFYPDPLFVRTSFPGELSWLFYALRDTFGDLIDFGSKFYFYGHLAEAAILYSDQLDVTEDLVDLLLVVLDEAQRMAPELTSS